MGLGVAQEPQVVIPRDKCCNSNDLPMPRRKIFSGAMSISESC